MELKSDPEERKQQIAAYAADPNLSNAALIHLFDGYGDLYDQDIDRFGYHVDKHLDEFEDFVRISKDSRILDLAAGTGIVGEKLKERGYTNMDALDGSKGMLKTAKEKGLYKNCFHVLVGPDPIPGIQKDTYDAIICVGGLGPMLINQTSFESLAAITKSGGYIYFLMTVEFLFGEKEKFEDEMRRLQKEGIWRWVLMKESPDEYYEKHQTLVYAFKVLK